MQEKEQKISPVKQRILQFAASLGISKRDFYKNICISRGTLESPTGITEDVVAKFIATYPNVNIVWLWTGEGEMCVDDISETVALTQSCGNATMQEKEQKNDGSFEILVNTIREQAEKIGEMRREILELKRQLQTSSSADAVPSNLSALA